MKSFTIEDISKIVNGSVSGTTTRVINGPEHIKYAKEDQITFIGNKKYIPSWEKSKATVALIDEKIELAGAENKALIKVKNVDLAMALVLELFVPEAPVFDIDIHPSAVVHSSAVVGNGCKIGANCYVGANVKLSDGVTLYPNVTVLDSCTIGKNSVIWSGTVIRERCEIGAYCILHPNVTIGADGFGYRPGADGRSIVKIPHIGIVVIGNGVEIGANSCVDRGKFSATTIGDGTKIDNLVQIAHNCEIGRMCLIASGVGISGSVTVGDGVVMAGQVGIKDHITIGNKVTIGGRAGVMNDIPDGETILGYPAINYRECLKQWAAVRNLAKNS